MFKDYQHMISTLGSLHVELFASPGHIEPVRYQTYNAVEPVARRVLSFLCAFGIICVQNGTTHADETAAVGCEKL